MINIKPEIKKECNLVEALEYIAFEWEPYIGNDELLLDQKRCRVPFCGERTTYYVKFKNGRSYKCDYSPAQQEYVDEIHIAIAKLENLIRTKKIKFSYEGCKIVKNLDIETPPSVEYMLDNPERVCLWFGKEYLRQKFGGGHITSPALIIHNSLGEIAFSTMFFNFIDLKNAVAPYRDISEDVKNETHANLFTAPENLNSPDLLVLMEALKRGIYIDKNYKTSNYNSKKKLINDLIAIYDEMNFPYSDKILDAMGTILADLSFRNKKHPNQK